MHDLNAICDSLESLSSSTPLKLLTVRLLYWPLYQHSDNKKCHCVLSRPIAKFAGILEGRQFLGTQVLDLNVPGIFDLDIVVDELRKWEDTRELRWSYIDEYEGQCNMVESICHLYPI